MTYLNYYDDKLNNQIGLIKDNVINCYTSLTDWGLLRGSKNVYRLIIYYNKEKSTLIYSCAGIALCI
ncbi:MAG: hypothetical protein ABIH18_03905 [Candidatus Omnitrophota bacterium]